MKYKYNHNYQIREEHPHLNGYVSLQSIQIAVSNSKFFTNFVTNFGDLSNSKILRKIFAKISTDFH